MVDHPHKKPVKLKCEGCDAEAEFKSAEEAFHTGWDCPPRIPLVVTFPNVHRHLSFCASGERWATTDIVLRDVAIC
jgi:hypothetical protein